MGFPMVTILAILAMFLVVLRARYCPKQYNNVYHNWTPPRRSKSSPFP